MPATRRVSRIALALATAAAVVIPLAACDSGASGGDYLTKGKLTVATGDPAYGPYVIDNKPQNGKGFESAVVYAVADKLGFAKKDVVWTRVDFDKAIAPGAKDFDLDIQQYSITAARKKKVDFSSPYYQAPQAVVTLEGSQAASATSLKDLRSDLIGVAAGTTSLTVVENDIKPSQTPQVFNTNEDAVTNLTNGQVDAIVVDLPTAFYLVDSELKKGKIVGQLAGSSSGGDEWGILLAKDSPLTSRVSKAIDALKADGTLAALQEKWLGGDAGAPVLK